ncbi:MAG TPA: hypothetical protein VH682_00935 [Gemmataceae bacterium]
MFPRVPLTDGCRQQTFKALLTTQRGCSLHREQKQRSDFFHKIR